MSGYAVVVLKDGEPITGVATFYSPDRAETQRRVLEEKCRAALLSEIDLTAHTVKIHASVGGSRRAQEDLAALLPSHVETSLSRLNEERVEAFRQVARATADDVLTTVLGSDLESRGWQWNKVKIADGLPNRYIKAYKSDGPEYIIRFVTRENGHADSPNITLGLEELKILQDFSSRNATEVFVVADNLTCGSLHEVLRVRVDYEPSGFAWVPIKANTYGNPYLTRTTQEVFV